MWLVVDASDVCCRVVFSFSFRTHSNLLKAGESTRTWQTSWHPGMWASRSRQSDRPILRRCIPSEDANHATTPILPWIALSCGWNCLFEKMFPKNRVIVALAFQPLLVIIQSNHPCHKKPRRLRPSLLQISALLTKPILDVSPILVFLCALNERANPIVVVVVDDNDRVLLLLSAVLWALMTVLRHQHHCRCRCCCCHLPTTTQRHCHDHHYYCCCCCFVAKLWQIQRKSGFFFIEFGRTQFCDNRCFLMTSIWKELSIYE